MTKLHGTELDRANLMRRIGRLEQALGCGSCRWATAPAGRPRTRVRQRQRIPLRRSGRPVLRRRGLQLEGHSLTWLSSPR